MSALNLTVAQGIFCANLNNKTYIQSITKEDLLITAVWKQPLKPRYGVTRIELTGLIRAVPSSIYIQPLSGAILLHKVFRQLHVNRKM